MDLETENRIAAILLKEAAELRRQAQTEGALAYLRQPTARIRPNSRFLTATVLGVQQANRAVEVNEMWRLREKQLELDDRLRGRIHESTSGRGHGDLYGSQRSSNNGCHEVEPNASASQSSKKRTMHDRILMEGEGLRDDEVDEFLQSRIKRGRGAVGSRMDETGPYLPTPNSKRSISKGPDEELGKHHVLLGPEKPMSLTYTKSSEDESLQGKKRKKMGLSKKHSKNHKSREPKDKRKRKTKMDEKKRKKHRR